MLIVHGRVNTFGSSIVASYCDRVGVAQRVALDHLQRLAVEVAGHVEPRAVVVVRDVDDQRVAFPAPARVAHPEIDARRVRRRRCV